MIDYSIPAKNAMMTAVRDLLDVSDPDAGYMEIYTATKPTTPGAAITTQTLLGTIPLALPCGTVVDGELVLSCPIEEDNGPATGNIAWGRLFNGNDDWVADYDVGITSSGAALELNRLEAYTGGIIRINYGSIIIS